MSSRPHGGLERQIVARHLAGTTERDIAEEFYLTPQAVRSTIESVQQCLGVEGRSELRTALRSLRAGAPVPSS